MNRGIVLVVLASCGGDPAPIADAEPEPDAAVETISLHGVISEWQSPTTTNGVIEGAEVCVVGTTRCATTDAAGEYTLEEAVPASEQFAVSAEADGYLRTVILWRPEPDDLDDFGFAIITDAVAQQKVADAGGTWPLDTTGIVEVASYVFDGGFDQATGLTATITPASGTGAVYLDTDGYPDTSLTATTSVGLTMFVNVAPGDAVVTPTLAGHACVRAQDGWSGSAPGTLAVTAEAATLTFVNEACTPR